VRAGVASAYSATGRAWETGPGRIYNRLAEVLVGVVPVPLAGRTVLDVGAGTGAATRAVTRAGGRAVASDVAFGMLVAGRRERPPAVQADAVRLPFATGGCGGVVAAFSLNHVPDPATALAECARACSSGSPLVASSYAADDGHPAKDAVTAALADHGYRPEPWSVALHRDVVPLLADPDRCRAVARRAGLEATVHALRVPFPELGPDDLVTWRLGMAQHAPFLAALTPDQRRSVRRRALALLGDPPPLVRSILVISAVAG
jgi:ubiquinone/menaquinone biosynthesis C-methylase UbiE